MSPGISDPQRRRLVSRWPSRRFRSISWRSSSPRRRPARHRGEDRCDRPALRVRRAVRDGGRARWIRQDDAARTSGPRPIHVRSPGSRSTAETMTVSCSCATSPPRSTGVEPLPARGVRRAVGPGGIDLVDAGSAPRERVGLRSRSRWSWCSTTCTWSETRPVSTCSRRCVDYVPAGSQIAVASREEPALPLARWRMQGLVDEVGVTELRFDRAGGPDAAGRRGRRPGRPASSPS